MSAPSKIRAAVCQFQPRHGAIDENIESAEAAISRASDNGAKLVVLPELWSCGLNMDNLAGYAEKTPQILEQLGRLAAGHRVIVAGSLPERSGNKVFNTLHVLDETGVPAGAYRKIHLFSLMDEDKYFSRGSRPVICRTMAGRLGLMICYDLRFPELCRSLAVNGADIVIVCAQWPASRIDHWDALLRARAIENQIFIVAANRCDNADAEGFEFNGHSRIISPTGEILAFGGEAPGEADAEIDLSEIRAFRNRFSTIDERIPDAYEF